MSDAGRLLESYVKAVEFPGVSGFEVLELLDVRSRIAAQEADLDPVARERLEDADSMFLRHSVRFYECVALVGDLRDLRRRASVPCSHWWWYLEKLGRREATA